MAVQTLTPFWCVKIRINQGHGTNHHNRDAQQSVMQNREGDHLCSDDKRLVVFLTRMEKPPTFCHLSNASRKFEVGLQLYMGSHILTTVL